MVRESEICATFKISGEIFWLYPTFLVTCSFLWLWSFFSLDLSKIFNISMAFQDLDFEFTLFHDHDFEVSRHFFNFFVAPPSTKAPFSSDRSYFTKDQVTPPTPYKKSTSRHSPPIILSLFTNYSITKPSKK